MVQRAARGQHQDRLESRDVAGHGGTGSNHVVCADMGDPRSTTVSRVIHVPPEAVYRAYLDQDAIATWLPPGSMTAIVHAFDGRVGGAFSMSLVYPENDGSARGKTSGRTDTFQGR